MNAKNPQPRTGRRLSAPPQPAPACRLAALLAGCAMLSAAEDPVLIGQWPDQVRGNPNSVVVADNLAYVAAGVGGLFIFDVSNPASPVRIGGYDTPGEAVDVVVSGGLAFVADTEAGIQIVDVGSPSSPVRIGGYETAGAAYGVAVSGSLVLVASDSAGLQIIDAANPVAPVLLGGYNTTGRASGVTLHGSRAYVADGVAGLQTIDLTNPASPTLVSTFKTGGWAQDVVVVDNYAYVADGLAGMMMIDITNPAAPARVGSHDTAGYAFSLNVLEDRVFVADADAGVVVLGFDPENPTTFQVLGSYATTGAAYSAALVGELTYIADRSAGLEIVNLSDPANPVRQGGVATSGYSWTVALTGDIALVADDDNGLRIIDVANPASPGEISSHDAGDVVYGVTVSGNLAYVAASAAGLKILDISSPAAPVAVGGIATLSPATSVTLTGDLALVSSGTGLEIINVSTPASPSRIFSFEFGAEETVITGNLALVAAGFDGLQILDLTNPGNPQVVGTLETSGYAGSVAMSGTYALITVDETGLEIVDVANPASPLLVGSYPVAGFTWDVAVNGNLAFLATDVAGVEIVDITDPANPQAVSALDTAGRALSVATTNDMLFVADAEQGLAIVDLNPEPAAPFIVRAPLSRTNSTSTVAAFSVSAGGTQPLGYQWLKDGTPLVNGGRISGATSETLVITGIEVDDAGQYTVTVSNLLDEDTSEAATLTVIGLPQTITFEPLADVELPSAPLTLAATASSGLPVAFEVASGPATLDGSTLTLTGPGSVTVRALQSGGGYYAAAAPVERTFTVTANLCPTLSLTAPYADLSVPAGSLITVQWTGDDDHDEGAFRLYYDVDDNSENGNEVLLLGPVATESGFTTLDTAALAPGTYWLLGRLTDGECEAVSYAPGRVTVIDPPDLAFATNPIEVTQAIQTADNQLSLVAGRTTVARVYVRVTDREVAEPVTVQLAGTSNGSPLPGSPLSLSFSAPAVTTLDRSQASHGANFSLPSTWTAAGSVTLQATVTASAGNPLVSGDTAVTFTTRRSPTIWVIPINLGTGGSPIYPSTTEISDQLSYVAATFPVPSVNAVIHYWNQTGPMNGEAILSALSTYLDSLEDSWLDSYLATGEEPFSFPEALYGFTPSNVPRSSSNSQIVGSLALLDGDVAMGYWSESQVGTTAHGLNHALGASGSWGRHVGASSGNNSDWGCGATLVDSSWPWTNDDIQTVGFDTRSLTPVASTIPDFMSWCQDAGTTVQWISTYRWSNMFNHFAPATGASGSSVVRRASLPGGIQLVVQVSGTITSTGTGTLASAARQAGRLDTSDPAGAYGVQLLNSQGAVLEDFPFSVSFEGESGPLTEVNFRFNLPVREGIAAIVLKQGGQVLDQIQVSPGVPTVRVLTPNGGENWDGIQTITWEAGDPDGNPLTFNVAYSSDGIFWLPLNVGPVTGTSLEVNTANLAGTAQGRIRVVASDGFNTASDQSDAVFTVPQKAPVVTIVSPAAGTLVEAGATVTLEGFASDVEDMTLLDAAYEWSLNGTVLGTGSRLTTTLPEGDHTLLLAVTDSHGNRTEATVGVTTGIRVESAQAQDGTLQLSFRAAANQAYVVWFRDSLSGGAWQQLGTVPAAAATRVVPIVDSLPADGVQRFYRITTQ